MLTHECYPDIGYDGVDLVWLRTINPAAIEGNYCGNKSRGGYRRFDYGGKRLTNHVVIWNIFEGEIPKGMQVDHINHNRMDNRRINLRLVSAQDNSKNKSVYKNNTSGFPGVTIEKNGKFKARISLSGKRIALGTFEFFDDACQAVIDARKRLKFHHNHGR